MSYTVKNKRSGSRQKESALAPYVKKKRVIIIIAAAALALALLAVLNQIDFDLAFQKLFAPSPLADSSDRKITFAQPDYREDIFEDKAYIELNRYLRYTEGPLSTLITDDSLDKYGGGVVLINSFIETVIAGKSKSLSQYFTDEYLKNKPFPDKFTMQKIYDAEIEFYSQNVINQGKTDQITRFEYIVRYKIMENNGTFRSDVGSDAAVPEIFEVLVYDLTGETLINSITKIKRAAG